MSKMVTLRLDEETYQRFKRLAEDDNRPLSNFIETSVLRYLESTEHVDEFEMQEIRDNAGLNQSLQRGVDDAREGRGRFA